MDFLIATGNPHKLIEFKRILEPLGIRALGFSDLGIDPPEVEETGETFEENALIKARSAEKATGLPTLSDDSGLCVDALGGAPGVYSARYGGVHGDDELNNKKLISALSDIPEEKRTARYVAAIACVTPAGEEFTVRGECEGKIGFFERGSNGFGYDPLFISEIGCFGEVSAQEKDKISHRAVALSKLKEELIKRLGDENAHK